MAHELRIGPVALEDKIDPTDPNEAGQIAGPQGARYDTLRIIQANADAYAEITPIQALRKDEERSAHLDLDEVHKAAGLPDDVVVEGAGVKGTSNDPNQLAVVYLVRYPPGDGQPEGSGRSARGVVRYNKLRRSIDAFETDKERKLGASRAARAAGATEDEVGGEDPRVERLSEALADLEDRLNAAEARAAEAEQAREQAEADAALAREAAEPYPGYSGATIEDVKSYLNGVPEGPERETAKALVRRAEEMQEKPRSGVLEATEPAAPEPPADD